MIGPGTKVRVKAGWLKGEWGIVRVIIGSEYHVAIADSPTQTQTFTRREIETA